MKYRLIIISLLFAFSPCFRLNAQGTFQNLNFEAANPISAGVNGNPNVVTAASAFPDWSVYSGSTQLSVVNYNDPDLGTTTVGLVGPASPIFPAIDGNYSVLLQGGGTASAASISQTGLIPVGSEFLLFKAQDEQSGGVLDLSIGGQNVPFAALITEPNYTLYEANISAWADTTEQLSFSAPEGFSGNNWVIDDISFSPTAVPEPNAAFLAGIGGLILGSYRKWNRQRE